MCHFSFILRRPAIRKDWLCSVLYCHSDRHSNLATATGIQMRLVCGDIKGMFVYGTLAIRSQCATECTDINFGLILQQHNDMPRHAIKWLSITKRNITTNRLLLSLCGSQEYVQCVKRNIESWSTLSWTTVMLTKNPIRARPEKFNDLSI